MSKRFDVVVVGGGVSAVMTAALLAKRGLRGLLVDQGELATAGGDHPGDQVWAPAGSAVTQRALHEIELEHAVTRSWVPEETLLHVVLPDERLDLTSDEAANERALTRIAGASGPALWSALREVHDQVGAFLATGAEVPPPSGFFARRSAAALARKAPVLATRWHEHEATAGAPPELAALVAGLSPFLTHFDLRDPAELRVARLARPLMRFLAGVGTVRHAQGLRGLVLDWAQTKALQVRKTAVERVEVEGKGWSVRLAGARDPVLADALVDASIDASGVDVIPTKQQGRQLPLLLQSAKPRGDLFAVGLEVDRVTLPPGLGSRLLLLPDEGAPDGRPLWLTLRAGRRPERVQVIGLYPFGSAQAHGARGAADEARIRARIEAVFPFLADGQPEPFLPASADFGPPLAAHPHFDPGLDEVTGLGGIPTRAPLRNLFFAGPAVAPGLGREGEFLAALQAADAVEAALGGAKKKAPRVEV